MKVVSVGLILAINTLSFNANAVSYPVPVNAIRLPYLSFYLTAGGYRVVDIVQYKQVCAAMIYHSVVYYPNNTCLYDFDFAIENVHKFDINVVPSKRIYRY